jgi:hypothetical protein
VENKRAPALAGLEVRIMKTLVNTTRSGSWTLVAVLVVAGSCLFGGARSAFAADDCATSADCDRRCGKAPTLDGTIESLERLRRYLDCRHKCTLEIFECHFPSPAGGVGAIGGGLVIVPDEPIIDPVGGADLPVVLIEGEGAVSSADVNGDGVVDLSDAARILNYLFIGGDAPAQILITELADVDLEPRRSADGRQLLIQGDFVLSAGDTDGNGRIDIADAVLILRHLFSGGQEPIEIVARRRTLPPVRPLSPVLPILERR